MASELRVTTVANNAGTESVDTTYVINGSAKQWIRYGSDHIIDNSFSTSSLTDTATGKGTVALSITMAVADIIFGNNSQGSTSNTGKSIACVNPTTTSYIIETYESDTLTDAYATTAVIFGDLA